MISKARLDKLKSLDKIRIGKLIEIVQGTTTYSILALISSYILNKYVFVDLTSFENHSFSFVLLLVIFELSILTIMVFYIRKLFLVIPSIPNLFIKDFVPHTTNDMYTYTIALLVIILATIDKLHSKIDYLKSVIGNTQ